LTQAASLIVDRWIREGLPFQWSLNPVTTPRLVQPGEEWEIVTPSDLRCNEGVLWGGGIALSSPNVALRFRSEGFDTGENYTISYMLTTGEWLPNQMIWVKGPPTIPFYVMIFGIPWCWKNWAALSVINLDTVPVYVIKYMYMSAKQIGPKEAE